MVCRVSLEDDILEWLDREPGRVDFPLAVWTESSWLLVPPSSELGAALDSPYGPAISPE